MTQQTQAGEAVGLKDIARYLGIAPDSLSRLIRWHSPGGKFADHPYPPPPIRSGKRGKLWWPAQLPEWAKWYATSPVKDRTVGRPTTNPPEKFTSQQWRALVLVAAGVVRQEPPPTQHARAYGVSHRISTQTMGSLMVEGLVTGVGKRGDLTYVLTDDGLDTLARHPTWVAKVRQTEGL